MANDLMKTVRGEQEGRLGEEGMAYRVPDVPDLMEVW